MQSARFWTTTAALQTAPCTVGVDDGQAAERTVAITARTRDGRPGIGLRVDATLCGPPDNREQALDVADLGDGT